MSLTWPGLPPDRLTQDPIERRMYARDLAPVPALMVAPFFRTLPDYVARPADAAQTAAIVGHAVRERVPVTPRAAASTSFYNAVPLRGGLVLDVNDLHAGPDLDPVRRTVRVGPAVTWFQLDDQLRRHGFAVKAYPSSAVSATVGGWISMQGHGLGSLQSGGVGEHLLSLRVVLPNGELVTVTRETDPPLEWFLAAEGTLGVIVEAELSVRPRPAAEAQHVRAYTSVAELGASVAALARSEPRPFTVFFGDAGYLDLLKQGGFHVPADPDTGVRGLLMAAYEGEPDDVGRGQAFLHSLAGRELPAETALDEWALRLFHLRTKRAGPSLLAAEMWLPIENVGSYLRDVAQLAARTRLTIGTYGLALTPAQAQVMSLYPADERHTASYLAAIGFTKALYDLGARLGGRPYGVGLWNTAYLGRIFTGRQLAELRARKARLDPAGLLNPGKLYAASFPLWPIAFGPGAAVLGAAHPFLNRRAA